MSAFNDTFRYKEVQKYWDANITAWEAEQVGDDEVVMLRVESHAQYPEKKRTTMSDIWNKYFGPSTWTAMYGDDGPDYFEEDFG